MRYEIDDRLSVRYVDATLREPRPHHTIGAFKVKRKKSDFFSRFLEACIAAASGAAG
jgi:hypothetical protein